MNIGQVREKTLIVLLCLVGGYRVFLFSAAFPFFSNVDERMHTDLVYKYSQGYLPSASTEHLSRGFVELMLLYGSPEYMSSPDEFAGGVVPKPSWRDPNVQENVKFKKAVSKCVRWINPQTGSFPVYYMVAGLWYSVGRLLGMEGGHLLYWVRFMNAPLFAVLVWLSYLFGRALFSGSLLQRIGLPIMVAFFPQDVFYSVHNDAITPLLFGASFLMLLGIYFSRESHLYHIFAGLAVAGTFLTKLTNLPVLFLFVGIVLLKIRNLVCEKQMREYLSRLAVLVAAAGVPIGIWLLRNYVVLGDVSGAADKIQYLGWSMKAIDELTEHPFFSPDGLFLFFVELTKRFWRGEFIWHKQPIAWSSLDIFYIATTGVFIIVSGLGLLLGWSKANKRYRLTLAVSFVMVIVSVLFWAFLSIIYDFGDCPNPSRARPYFVAGRLISGILVPFLAIYLDGLSRLLSRLSQRLSPLAIVVVIATVITFSEVVLSWEVFRSPYNWFHLR